MCGRVLPLIDTERGIVTKERTLKKTKKRFGVYYYLIYLCNIKSKQINNIMLTSDDFTRVNNDINGNPRYVCHLGHFISMKDATKVDQLIRSGKFEYTIDARYHVALAKAKQLGGKKFHNKQYGGGIVFQSYNLQSLVNEINDLIK